MTEKVKVAVYLRTANKNDISIQEQERKVLSLLDNEKYDIYDIYADNGFSGTNTDRMNYYRMLAAMQQKKFTTIVAYSMDRISRDLFQVKDFFKLTEKNNCDIKFLSNNIDSKTTSGRLICQMFNLFSTLDSELTSNE